jgi:hypothetical protein
MSLRSCLLLLLGRHEPLAVALIARPVLVTRVEMPISRVSAGAEIVNRLLEFGIIFCDILEIEFPLIDFEVALIERNLLR